MLSSHLVNHGLTFLLALCACMALSNAFPMDVPDTLTVSSASSVQSTPVLPPPPPPTKLTIVQLNIFMRPPGISTGSAGDFKRLRLEKFKALLRDNEADIFVLAECFAQWAPLVMEAAQKYGYFTYQGPNEGLTSAFPQIISSGLVIISRYELEDIQKVKFTAFDTSTSDMFSQKGFIYGKVKLSDTDKMHLVGTHLQASWYPISDKGRNARMAQLAQIHGFLEKQGTEDNYPKLLVGDLNVNSIHPELNGDSSYDDMMALMSTGGSDAMEDIVYKLKGFHPPTYGERGPDGRGVETVISGWTPDVIEESLDYTLFAQRGSSWTPVDAQVLPYKIDPDQFPMNWWESLWRNVYGLYPTQISDHNAIKITYVKQ